MRGLTVAMALFPLLMDPGAAMAQQGTGTTRTNPLLGQETTSTPPAAAPTSPTSQGRRSSTNTTNPGGNQFQSEATAKQACGTDTVVWVNTGGSKTWHVSGDRYYGHTKRGAYMCEQAAQQVGYHAAGASSHARGAATQTH